MNANELLAEITFPYLDSKTVDVNHTFVDSSLRGQGIAGKLMEELVKDLNERGDLRQYHPVPTLPAGLKKHPEYKDLVK